MALIVCSECGKEFSERAGACPHCGCPNEKKKAEPPLVRDGVSGLVNGIMAVVGILLVTSFVSPLIDKAVFQGLPNRFKQEKPLPNRNLP